MADPNRVPAGVRTGGQFAAASHPEAGCAALTELEALATRGKTSHDAEATLAVLRGTARAELADRFAASGMDYDVLAAKVGHSPRVARRVVTGKEPLNETGVAAYFRAMADA